MIHMSESVKVGAVGKNPAIDKINKLNEVDIKNYAVSKMEELVHKGKEETVVPVDFSRVNWDGKQYGDK